MLRLGVLKESAYSANHAMDLKRILAQKGSDPVEITVCPASVPSPHAAAPEDPCEVIQQESKVDYQSYESGEGKWNPSASSLVLPIPDNHPLRKARDHGFRGEAKARFDRNSSSDAFAQCEARCANNGVDRILSTLDADDM